MLEFIREQHAIFCDVLVWESKKEKKNDFFFKLLWSIGKPNQSYFALMLLCDAKVIEKTIEKWIATTNFFFFFWWINHMNFIAWPFNSYLHAPIAIKFQSTQYKIENEPKTKQKNNRNRCRRKKNNALNLLQVNSIIDNVILFYIF